MLAGTNRGAEAHRAAACWPSAEGHELTDLVTDSRTPCCCEPTAGASLGSLVALHSDCAMSQLTPQVVRRSSSPSPDRSADVRRRTHSRLSGACVEDGAVSGPGGGAHLQVPSTADNDRDRMRRMTMSDACSMSSQDASAPAAASGAAAASPPHDETPATAPAAEPAAHRSPYTSVQVEKIRRKLKYHFMTPQEKWKAKRAFPYKLLVQIFKILIVTFQLVSFGSERTGFVDFTKRTTLAMCHMYLMNWDPTYETNPYPAAIGQYALYDKESFFSHINYALSQYNRTREITLGIMDFPSGSAGQQSHNMKMCKEFFKVGEVNLFNESYNLNPELDQECVVIEPVAASGNGTHGPRYVYDVVEFLKRNNKTLLFESLHKLTLEFGLKIMRVKEAGDFDPFDDPICLSVTGVITYDNSGHNGQVPVQLTLADLRDLGCQGTTVLVEETGGLSGLILGLDALSLIVCIVSFFLCTRSLIKAFRLVQLSKKFFNEHFQHRLSAADRFEFVSLWFVMIVVSDILLSIGTCTKIYIRIQGTHSYTICGLILGLSNLLVWLGILRYLGFFKKYNTLLLTIKKAAPDMLRFLVCALVIYSSFLFCGWIVLGPYHVKFATISTTSECLFALINGDDMFSTFSIISMDKAPLEVWLFSRAYIYLFSASYIYLVLSLFIAVIMDSYETIKYCFLNGFPKSFMQQFIDTCPDSPASPSYLADELGDASRCGFLKRSIATLCSACLGAFRRQLDRCHSASRRLSAPVVQDDQRPICSDEGGGVGCCCDSAPANQRLNNGSCRSCVSTACMLPTCTVRTVSMNDDVDPVVV